MTIQEAIKSGKRFRRIGDEKWCQVRMGKRTYWGGRFKKLYRSLPGVKPRIFNPTIEDILADDWEVEDDGTTSS